MVRVDFFNLDFDGIVNSAAKYLNITLTSLDLPLYLARISWGSLPVLGMGEVSRPSTTRVPADKTENTSGKPDI